MSNNRPAPIAVNFNHSLPAQLRFNDIDALGHVNNNVYLQFFDLGKYDYFKQVMGEDFDIKVLAVVVVNINCDFMAPAFLDEPLEVRTATAAIGDKSVTLVQQIVNADTGQIKCQGTTVMASFDLATGKSAPVNDKARAALCAFENRTF